MSLECSDLAEDDLDRVIAVEKTCHAFPWTRGNFVDSLRAGHSAWLAREDGAMIGYAVMMRVLDEAHLLNITIVPARQRQGLGRELLDFLFRQARLWGATRVLLEVRPGNLGALALYLKGGFAEIGRRKNYYPAAGGREDAIVMEKLL